MRTGPPLHRRQQGAAHYSNVPGDSRYVLLKVPPEPAPAGPAPQTTPARTASSGMGSPLPETRAYVPAALRLCCELLTAPAQPA